MIHSTFEETQANDAAAEEDQSISLTHDSHLADPLLSVKDLIAAKVVGSRDGVHAAMKKGWLPAPIRWPNGRMFWRLSAIEQAVAKIEAGGSK